MRTLLAASLGCSAFFGAACATKPAVSPQAVKMQVNNMRTFDVASCAPRTVATTATPEGITGALMASSPAFHECFMDPKSRAGAEINSKLKATAGETTTFEITGTGISEFGKACIMAAAKRIEMPKPGVSSAPIVGELNLVPNSPAVTFGLNEASDAVANIRLAQPSACSCYASIGSAPAPILTANFTLHATAPADIALAPESGPMAECLKGKLAAVNLPKADVAFAYQFLLMNSHADAPTPGAAAPLQNLQWDGIREQQTADVMIASGGRADIASKYVSAAKAFNAKPEMKKYPALRSMCLDLVEADGSWLGALEKLKGSGDSVLTLVRGEQAKDAATWGPLEARLSQIVGAYGEEAKRVSALKDSDLKTCPKELKR